MVQRKPIFVAPMLYPSVLLRFTSIRKFEKRNSLRKAFLYLKKVQKFSPMAFFRHSKNTSIPLLRQIFDMIPRPIFRKLVLIHRWIQNKNYRHSKYVKFLAERHENGMMKLRFVLNPFSFVFLLQGKDQYHFVLETLDTEEATYIWHTNTKTKKDLMKIASLIDGQLNVIKENGRQTFLDSNPENFTRILHNYADKDRGFVVWLEVLEKIL
jgi:hypothetical protein